MAERFSLKDHLFNRQTLGQLADEFAAGVPGFDAARFLDTVVPGLEGRELLQRLDWITDCLEPHLPQQFPEMAAVVEAALPPKLDPTRTDDDFGHFIHSVPGILAVRHGLEDHPERALDLIHAATQRFSMELYIRPFINAWPDLVLARMMQWTEDPNYHVRRLVSEGTRPKLPWAKAVTLTPDQTFPFLERLHADPTRYVTRSVANHLNDLTKTDADPVIARLDAWHKAGRQDAKELAWMTRHALRTQIKAGTPAALRAVGFDPDAPISVTEFDVPDTAAIGDALSFSVTLRSDVATSALVDYVFRRRRSDGTLAEKVHKLKQVKIPAGKPVTLTKRHVLKGDATTYRLFPGEQALAVQVNGRIRAEAAFDLTDPNA